MAQPGGSGVEPLVFDGSTDSFGAPYKSPRTRETPKPSALLQSASFQVSRTQSQTAAMPAPIAEWVAPYTRLVEDLMKHQDAAAFNDPIDKLFPMEAIPAYFQVVKKPMDLGTIKKNLQSNHYHKKPPFMKDVRQVWTNCKLYNSEQSAYWQAANRMSLYFDQKVKEADEQMKFATKPAEAKKPKQEPRPKEKKKNKKKSEKRPKTGGAASDDVQALARKIDELQREISKQPKPLSDKPEMEWAQQEELTELIGELSGNDKHGKDKLTQVLEIIKSSSNVLDDGNEDEDGIELDLESLPNDTQWRLWDYVMENHPRKKSAAQSGGSYADRAALVRQQERAREAESSSDDDSSSEDSD